MKTSIIIFFVNALLIGLIFIFWNYQISWIGELIIIILTALLFQQRESVREELEDQQSHLSSSFKPMLKVEIFETTKLILSSFIFILMLYAHFTIYKILFVLFIVGYNVLELVIPIIHQFTHPRQLYLTNDSIHYYEIDSVKIPLENVTKIELRSRGITFYGENFNKNIPFRNRLTEADFLKWNIYLKNTVNVYNYLYINDTKYLA